jgi:hypothetical protein
MHPHLLLGVLHFYFAKVTKTNQFSSYQHIRKANIGITAIRHSKLYILPPSQKLPLTVILTLDSPQSFIECILSTPNILIY